MVSGLASMEVSGENGSADVPALAPAPPQAATSKLAAKMTIVRARFIKAGTSVLG
jgi:hypothetical protein